MRQRETESQREKASRQRNRQQQSEMDTSHLEVGGSGGQELSQQTGGFL